MNSRIHLKMRKKFERIDTLYSFDSLNGFWFSFFSSLLLLNSLIVHSFIHFQYLVSKNNVIMGLNLNGPNQIKSDSCEVHERMFVAPQGSLHPAVEDDSNRHVLECLVLAHIYMYYRI